MSKKDNKPAKRGRKPGQVLPLTPRQDQFIYFWLNPKSPTFSNVYQSAVAAGYSETYAMKIASEGLGNLWVKNSRKLADMKPDHIVQALQKEATDNLNKGSERIKALELLAKMHNMVSDKHVVAHVNIESALEDLK